MSDTFPNTQLPVQVTRVILTRKEAGAVAVQTKLTINWTGMTEENYRAFAEAGLIIKMQASFRKQGIPPEATVLAINHVPGTRTNRAGTSIEKVKTALASGKLSRDDLLELLNTTGDSSTEA